MASSRPPWNLAIFLSRFLKTEDGKKGLRNDHGSSALPMDILGPADEPDATQASAMRLQVSLSSGNHVRMTTEAEIVISAEVEDLLGPALNIDLDALRSDDKTFALEGTRFLKRMGFEKVSEENPSALPRCPSARP